MCDNTESTNEVPKPAIPILRNGMDYEPKKTYPPDYSSVPDVREWQMSPFGKERFDLDEIQRLEKKGAKGKAELEKLLKMREKVPSKEEPEVQVPPPPCPVCKERERLKGLNNVRCSLGYLYQPYGPSMIPSTNCGTLEPNKLKPYTYMGPSSYADFYYRMHTGGVTPVIPCADLNKLRSSLEPKNNYIPYGPTLGITMNSNVYEPMGPTINPRIPE